MKKNNNNNSNKDIAIIGASIRFPKSNELNEFWEQLLSKDCLITPIPRERFNKYTFSEESIRKLNFDNICGGFIDDVDCFDASFFNISPREAMFMDPQQRMAMELTWKAIEDAGYRASTIKGTKTGVFMGACNNDYTEIMEKEVKEIDAYMPTGTSPAVISNRISYWFDFNGPSMTIDTACASSLVAIHQAVRSLQMEDCDCAIAGGVNLCWTPRRFIALSQSGMLSKDGKCKAFDENADGYVRSEGGGVLVLKPLDKAVEANDDIYAVIKGIGTNHGGRTNSLTITNPKAHAELLTEVYEKAGISPDTVSYIETHGPGTPLGDPIEIHGLKTAFDTLGKLFDKDLKHHHCGLGSVKTNIGHLEAAAGIAGIIKVIISMKHQTLPASINFKKLNPVINLSKSPFYIVNETKPWEKIQGDGNSCYPRRAGVSSFGFGGSNSHIILEEYDKGCKEGNKAYNELVDNNIIEDLIFIPLSAKNTKSLNNYVQNLMNYLKGLCVRFSNDGEKPSELNNRLKDIAYTLQTGREPMKERVIFITKDITSLINQLEDFLQNKRGINNCWQGCADKDKDTDNILLEETDMQVLINKWISEKNFKKMAALWIRGYSFDWDILYSQIKPKRIHLITYPFNRKHYWMDCYNNKAGKKEKDTSEILKVKPMVTQNIVKTKETKVSLEPVKYTNNKNVKVSDKIQIDISLEKLQKKLTMSLAGVLYIEISDVNIDKKFIDIGLDSIVAVEWIRSINKQYKTSLTATVVYDYPSIRELSTYLYKKLNGSGEQAEKILMSEPKTDRYNNENVNKPKGILLQDLHENPTQLFKSTVMDKPKITLNTIDTGLSQVCASKMPITETNEHKNITSDRLQRELAETLAEVLYIDLEEVNIDKKFIDLGLDSIVAVEWIRLINKKYKTSIIASEVYEYPSVKEFSFFLQKQINVEGNKELIQSYEEMDLNRIIEDVYRGNLDIDKADEILNGHL